jgi:TRAP-type C4-dicarboxylate transport system permease small subunit
MKKIRFAQKLILICFAFAFIYNTYFGWNMTATSEAEKICDSIFHSALSICVVIYLLPLFDLFENLVQKMEREKENLFENEDKN